MHDDLRGEWVEDQVELLVDRERLRVGHVHAVDQSLGGVGQRVDQRLLLLDRRLLIVVAEVESESRLRAFGMFVEVGVQMSQRFEVGRRVV